MDLKNKIDEIVNKLKTDPQLFEKFKDDPVKALESIVGIDLPDEQIKSLVAGIKAKLGAEDVSDVIGKLGKIL